MTGSKTTRYNEKRYRDHKINECPKLTWKWNLDHRVEEHRKKSEGQS